MCLQNWALHGITCYGVQKLITATYPNGLKNEHTGFENTCLNAPYESTYGVLHHSRGVTDTSSTLAPPNGNTLKNFALSSSERENGAEEA